MSISMMGADGVVGMSQVEFFEHMGFRCPERKAVADFLQEVTSRKDQEQYWQHEKAAPYRYISVSEFAQAYPKFHVGESLARELATPFERSRSHPAALVRERYALSASGLFRTCMHRERVLMRRNTAYYVFKATQAATTALIAMSVFFRTTLSPSSVRDGELYLAALYFILIMNMLVVLSEMAVTIQRLPVFYKQRDALFYPPWAYVLPSCLLRLPMSLYESLIWVSLTYFTIGFSPDPTHFFRHWLILFMVHQMALSLFRLIGSVARVMTVAFTGGTFAIMVLVVLGGFIIDREHIPPWWIWAYWISPLAYAQNAIAVNEFLSSRWNSPPNPGLHSNASSLGHQVLLTRGFFDKPHWYWLGAAALLAYTLLFNLLYCFFLKTLNPLTTPNFTTPEKEPQPQPQSQSCSSKTLDKAISRVHSEDIEEQGVLPFTPVSIAFRHINYFIDMPAEMRGGGGGERRLQLLDDISGVFRPGVLTALVGVSGAGKTTLMDVLAGRKTSGYTEGEIFLNGYPKKQATFTRVSGYCEQVDVHSPNVTVHESLVYSAWLRLSNTVATSSVREAFVEEVMALVELTSARSALVTGLSTEARKRLSIAVELVANPSIIFMDEPTSGLDARAAAIVMRAVRNTVDTGRTVVCTIHQPNVDIFEAFDELMLLKRGGKIIYSGPLGQHSCKLVEYFQSIPGVPPIREPTNPSTWILNVTSTTSPADFVALYATSSLHQQTEALIMKEITSPAATRREISFPTKYEQPLWEQCVACLWKQQKSYWRNPVYNVVRVVYTTVCGLTLGSVFWKLAVGVSQQQELVDLMGAMYAAVLFMGINYASGVQTVVAEERMVFYRERAAGMYSAVPYAFGDLRVHCLRHDPVRVDRGEVLLLRLLHVHDAFVLHVLGHGGGGRHAQRPVRSRGVVRVLRALELVLRVPDPLPGPACLLGVVLLDHSHRVDSERAHHLPARRRHLHHGNQRRRPRHSASFFEGLLRVPPQLLALHCALAHRPRRPLRPRLRRLHQNLQLPEPVA
jgi:ABC-type multidrug transport system ATPase subunit/ABC-type multidrug transport system permease subunit